MSKLGKTEAEWRAQLTPEEYRITREKGTERAFTGAYWQTTGKAGSYQCKCCGETLFVSDAKFDSGCGWPSFTQAMPGAVSTLTDSSHGMRRTEVRCAACEGHLGHVFDDGPEPTGQR